MNKADFFASKFDMSKHPTLTSEDKLVYMAIVVLACDKIDLMGDYAKTLARVVCIDEYSVIDSVNTLSELGLVEADILVTPKGKTK